MIRQLAYLAFEVKDLAAWESFATGVLGLGVAARAGNALELRMDSRAARFFLHEGPADDLAAVGWEVAGDSLAERLRGAGVDVADGTPAEARARRVDRLWRLHDPAGIPVELCRGAAPGEGPFQSPVVRAGFVAEEQGLGHLVLGAREPRASIDFYTRLLGFRLSDRIVADVHGYKADLSFFHVNGRHHSLAIGDAQKKRLHHFMLEARSMDDVGLAFDRALRAGVRIMQTLGRHPNDRMFSFYARTPSGFQFEYGWGGREVDDATWEPTTYDRISEWGHHPPAFLEPKR